MFDTDKFIEIIHGLPALWDKASSEYSNKDARQRAWVNVGESMHPEWPKFSYRERDDEIKQMKNKWRHIRDCFTRSLKKGKSGDPATSTKKKYVYADSLAFLLNTLEKRKTTGNLEDSDDNPDGGSEIDEHGANDEEDGNSANVSQNQQVPSTRTANLPNAQKRKRQNSSNLTPFQIQLLKKLDGNENKEDDGDKLFLLSLLPDYKKLNDDEKLDFKFMALQFFRDIRRKRVFRNQPEYASSNWTPGTSVQSPLPAQSQSLMSLTYPHESPLGYPNPISPNDSQLSTESTSGSSRLTYDLI